MTFEAPIIEKKQSMIVAPAKQQDPAAIQAITPICEMVIIQMMRRLVMISSMMNRIEMIMMMLVVYIYLCVGGSCDSGFNYGCNYV